MISDTIYIYNVLDTYPSVQPNFDLLRIHVYTDDTDGYLDFPFFDDIACVSVMHLMY